MTRRTVLRVWAASVGFLVLWYAAFALALLYAPRVLLEKAETVFLALFWMALLAVGCASIVIVYSTMVWAAIVMFPKSWLQKHGVLLHYLVWKELRDEID